jgi:hypothetical protein
MPFDSTKLRKAKGQDGNDPNIYSGPKTMPQDLPKLTNRELREKEKMSLLRKLKPDQRKAYKNMLALMDNPDVSPSVRFSATKFIIEMYDGLLDSLYKDKYDTEEGEKIQDSAPVFSLKIIKNEDSTEEPKG